MTLASLDAKLKDALIEAGIMDVLNRTGLRDPVTIAWHLIRRPQLARQEMDLLADYYTLKRKSSFLAGGVKVANPAKKVLLVPLSSGIIRVKMDAMLAKPLQLRGYTPVVVTNSSSWRTPKYFRLFGYDQFIFFDKLRQSVPAELATTEAERILHAEPSFRSLLDLEYRGVNVGRHVLSSIVRNLRHGSVDFSDPQVTELLTRLLPLSLRSVHAAELLLDRVEPEIVLFGEKGYTPYGEIFDVAVNRSINTIQAVESHRSDALVLKRYTRDNKHLHHFTLSAESWKLIRQMSWSAQHESELMRELRGRYEAGTWFSRKYSQAGKKIKSAEEVQEQLDLDSAKKTAVIFSHVLWDATFFFGENLFDDYEEWLVETVKVACTNQAVNWVIKLHPDYVWKTKGTGDNEEVPDLDALSTEVGRLPEHIKIVKPDTDISTFSFFEVTDYCLTVRGTIGIEMSCFGVPVFTAGTGRYSGLGFTIDSHSREEYLNKLHHIQDFSRLTSEQTLLAKKHAYALLKLRPWPFKIFEVVQRSLSELGHPLDRNIVIRADSFQDIVEASDLKAFAEWAINPNQLDYLLPFT